MKRFVFVVFAVLVLSSLLLAAPATRTVAAVDTYQVTGTVIDLAADRLKVVNKDKVNFDVARDDQTKVTGTIAKGKTVTITYRIIATNIVVK
jgi:hypothetical protein